MVEFDFLGFGSVSCGEFLVGENISFSEALRALQGDVQAARPQSLKVWITPHRFGRVYGLEASRVPLLGGAGTDWATAGATTRVAIAAKDESRIGGFLGACYSH